MRKKIVIIGGGPAGIEAARAAIIAGAQVTLVSNAPLGGRAGWHSLLPSKAWLALAGAVAQVGDAGILGLDLDGGMSIDATVVLDRIRQLAKERSYAHTDQLDSLGVRFVLADAAFLAPDQLQAVWKVGNRTTTLTADAYIIAAGSVPVFPAGLKPDGQRILAPRFAKHLEKLPQSIVVIGAGATGAEFTYLFSHLGVEVTWLVDEFGVLPSFHRVAAEFLAESLQEWGVRLIHNQVATHIDSHEQGVVVHTAAGERFPAEAAFVAIGRVPDLEALDLARAGLPPAGVIPTDGYGRTSQPHIYLVGDAAGPPMIANRATAQAWVAGRHAAGAATPPFRPESLVAAVYTEPQIAQVGSLSSDYEHVRLSYDQNLKARLLPEGHGFLEMTYHTLTGQIMGGVAVGAHAADIVTPIAQAIHSGATLDALAALYPAHPTLSELAFCAARQALQRQA